MAEMMHAGKLDKLVAFDKPLREPDGHGGVVEGWQEAILAVEERAFFRYLRGGETVQAARLEGRQPVVVTVYNSLATRMIDESWRMRDLREGDWASGDIWAGPIYNVRLRGVVSDDRRWIEILVESGVAT